MLQTIFIVIILYCLLTGKYKDYITIKTPIPFINKSGMSGMNGYTENR